MRWLCLIGSLSAAVAVGQPATPTQPPVVPVSPAPCPPEGDPTDRPECAPQGPVLNPGLGDINVGVPSSSGSRSASSSGAEFLGSIGGGDGEAWLVAVVIAAAALPVVVYALDDEAPVRVLDRWKQPGLQLSLGGGGVGLFNTGDWVPFGGLRVSGGYLAFGADAAAEGAFGGRSFGELSGHVLLRPPPKKHVELALAIGVRRTVFNGKARNGLDLELPHSYAFDYLGDWPIGAYLRPGFTFDTAGADVHLEGGLYFPLGRGAELRLGARAFSFEKSLTFGAELAVGASI